MLSIRQATPTDMAWVNAQYQQINFQLSNYSNELITIAELDGEKAGLGRLVTIADNTLELGGMYVLENYRNHSIARTIVTYLMTQAKGKTVYCLPFKHLQHFYISCGFKPVADIVQVPEKVLQKWEWCNKTYAMATLLLVQQL